MNILFFLFFAMLKVASAKLYCVDIHGVFICKSDSSKHNHVKIEIYDHDYSDSNNWALRLLDPDDLMGMTYTREDGSYSIYACGQDFDIFFLNPPEPFMYVIHNCNRIFDHSYTYEFSNVFVPETLQIGVLELDDGQPILEETHSMQEAHDNVVTDKVPENFENLDLVGHGYGGTIPAESIIAQTSLIPALMYAIQDKGCVIFIEIESSTLYNYYVGYDECDRKIYMRAQLRHESLDKGAELTEETLIFVNYNAMTGDIPFQFIDKKLGGQDNALNAFPLNPNENKNFWQTAITSVYNHLKKGEGNTAMIMYVMVYENDNLTPGRERPSQIFYFFKLYANGESVGEPILGKVQNRLPIFKRE